jgi:SAM-dependent methyltransferase
MEQAEIQTGSANNSAALDMYRWRSGFYDLQLGPYEAIREQAISLLELRPGQTVLDVGCGTGMSLPHLVAAVGPGGAVVAVDQCPEMLAQARQRVHSHGWKNVSLLCANIHEAPWPMGADAALLHFTHDILQTPEDLDAVLACLRPGASVVATGLQWAPPMYFALNTLVWMAAAHSVTTMRGLEAPWRLLAERGLALQVTQRLMGTVFMAHGCMPEP